MLLLLLFSFFSLFVYFLFSMYVKLTAYCVFEAVKRILGNADSNEGLHRWIVGNFERTALYQPVAVMMMMIHRDPPPPKKKKKTKAMFIFLHFCEI